MRKGILNISFILFSCFFILFSACIINTLSPEPTLFDLYLSEDNTLVFEIKPKSNVGLKTYGELYEFLSETENIRLLKKTNAAALNEIILYAPDGFEKKNALSELSGELSSGKRVLLNNEYAPFLTDGKLLLEGQLREVDGCFESLNTNEYPCLADMSIFRDSSREIDYDTFYVQYDGSFTEIAEMMSEFLNDGEENYEIAVSSAGNSNPNGFESADMMIIGGSLLAVVALSFNLSVFIKLWLAENRKVFFCKYLCGCDMARIRKETFSEFALNLAAGSAAAFALFLLLKLSSLSLYFELFGFAAAFIFSNILFVAVYLLTAKKELPKAESLVLRRAN